MSDGRIHYDRDLELARQRRLDDEDELNRTLGANLRKLYTQPSDWSQSTPAIWIEIAIWDPNASDLTQVEPEDLDEVMAKAVDTLQAVAKAAEGNDE